MQNIVDNYLQFYKMIVSEFTSDELDFIKSKLVIYELKKNEYYLEQGQVQKKLGFVASGLLRIYYIDARGNEISVGFSPENTFSTDYSAFVKQSPSLHNIKALEKTTIIDLDYKYVQEGYDRYKNFERFGRLITEIILIERQKRLESFLFETAEQRYIKFMEERQNLFNRVSLTHLSSFLGIERQSLSRIRKRLAP